VINAVVVLQARMASTRLPGKVMERLGADTLVAHCVRRLQAAQVGPVVVATTMGVEDDVVEAEASRLECTVVRGSTDDVLARFVMAAVAVPSRWVVRATADNPAVDIDSASRLLRALDESGAEYGVEQGLPHGGAVEVIAASTLHRVAELATDAYDREHVTPYVRRHAETFRIVMPDAPAEVRRPDLRLTVDTAEDLEFMRQVLQLAESASGPSPLRAVIAAADALRVEGFV
jgi:spore coat polysaccharide biosynthesis protein SpsF